MMSDDATSIELYSKNSIYTERNTVLSIPKVKSKKFQDEKLQQHFLTSSEIVFFFSKDF